MFLFYLGFYTAVLLNPVFLKLVFEFLRISVRFTTARTDNYLKQI